MSTSEAEQAVFSAVVDLGPAEWKAEFDAAVRQRLGIDGDEFLRRLDAGEFDDKIDDPIDHPGYSFLAMYSRSVR